MTPAALEAMASVYALGCGFAIREDRSLCIDNKTRIDFPQTVIDQCGDHYEEIRQAIIAGIIPDSVSVPLDGLDRVEATP